MNEFVLLIRVLCIWAVIGYFLAALNKSPIENKKQAIIQIIIYGPLCWIIFGIISLKYLKKGS